MLALSEGLFEETVLDSLKIRRFLGSRDRGREPHRRAVVRRTVLFLDHPEMRQTNLNLEWHFGMKVHIGPLNGSSS